MDSQEYIQLVLSEEIQKILHLNPSQDVYQFLLKNAKNAYVSQIAEQLEGRQKAKLKLPHWFELANVIFPARISMEQCSSELTALFKASIVKGESLIDLTGGFGVDDWAFSKHFSQVVYIEQQSHLSTIVAHNFKTLGCDNVSVNNVDAISFLNDYTSSFDCIYLDPARRKESQKVFKLSDCEPNIEEMQDLLWSKTNQILLKCSPLLDIDLAAKSLKCLSKVFVISVNNECKELLFLLQQGHDQEFEIEAVNLSFKNENETFLFTRSEEAMLEFSCQLPLQYLYEPNAAILKSGAFKSIAAKFNLYKLHPNSHLYTSDILINNFHGRKFKIIEQVPFSKKQIKKINLPLKANISTRNFPYSTDELRKMSGIKDGGDVFLFFTTLIDNSLCVLNCEKV